MSEDCGVCLPEYDFCDDPAEFYRSELVTARKARKCIECSDPIPVGTQYERVTGKWEGRVESLPTCKACRDVRTGLSCNGGTMHGCLWDDVHEILDSLNIECVRKVPSAEGRAKLLRAWEDWKFRKLA